MQDRVALVTGATGGIGFHTALGLAKSGARVIVTGRDVSRGVQAEEELRRRSGNDAVTFWPVDHARLDENRALGHRVGEELGRLDILVNNAGGVVTDGSYDGADLGNPLAYEPNLALNFLAPFALTDAVLPLMLDRGPGRIINVVARARHVRDPLSDDAEPDARSQLGAYARAKFLNLLWTVYLARHLATTALVVNAVDPGLAWTPGAARVVSAKEARSRYLSRLFRWFVRQKSPEAAARASIVASTRPEFARISGALVTRNGRPEAPPGLALDSERQAYAHSLGLRLVASAATFPVTAPAGPALAH